MATCTICLRVYVAGIWVGAGSNNSVDGIRVLKFVAANGPPYEDADAIDRIVRASADPDSGHINSQTDCTRRHLDLFLADVTAQQPVPTLRSFLKLYTSLGTKKLSNFLDADEEELVQEMMVLKQASRTTSR